MFITHGGSEEPQKPPLAKAVFTLRAVLRSKAALISCVAAPYCADSCSRFDVCCSALRSAARHCFNRKKVKQVNIYAALLVELSVSKALRCPVRNRGIAQFYLPPTTHEPYLPLLPSRKASPPFGWYSLRIPTNG